MSQITFAKRFDRPEAEYIIDLQPNRDPVARSFITRHSHAESGDKMSTKSGSVNENKIKAQARRER